MNGLKMLVSVLVLCFFLTTVVFSEDASKNTDYQKSIKKGMKPKSPLNEQSIIGPGGFLCQGYSGLISYSTVIIGIGSKRFITNIASKSTAFVVGDRVRVVSATTPADYMEGPITSFSGTVLTVNVDHIGGDKTSHSRWTISLTGDVGLKGDIGDKGDKGDKGDQGNKGDIGDKGDQGAKGVQGPMGPQGPRGEEGPMPRFGDLMSLSPLYPMIDATGHGSFASGDYNTSIGDGFLYLAADLGDGKALSGLTIDGTEIFVAPIGTTTIALKRGSMVVFNNRDFRNCRIYWQPLKRRVCSRDVCLDGCNYSSIQAAIDEADPGDTICIAPGAYKENVHINKSLNILGSSIDGTIVNGQGYNSVFTIDPGVTVSLSGMKIMKGRGKNLNGGGGIYVDHGILNLNRVVIIDNLAEGGSDFGGGIYNYGGTVSMSGVELIGNSASSYGGGIYNDYYSTVNMYSGSTISGNNASVDGGGICSHGTVNMYSGSTISGNEALGYGGGICNFNTVNMYSGSSITDNKASSDGGGISNYDMVKMYTGSSITGNTALGNGGGIMNQGEGELMNYGGTINDNRPNDIYPPL